uniref:Uncharacterized protein n=1 Tax=Oryza punctata TaxID=4537 RepID=A0A0E0KRQ7_ORYPU
MLFVRGFFPFSPEAPKLRFFPCRERNSSVVPPIQTGPAIYDSTVRWELSTIEFVCSRKFLDKYRIQSIQGEATTTTASNRHGQNISTPCTANYNLGWLIDRTQSKVARFLWADLSGTPRTGMPSECHRHRFSICTAQGFQETKNNDQPTLWHGYSG